MKEGAHKHATNENGEQEDVERSIVIECIVGIPKRSTTSSNSPPQEGDKGECSRYKYAFNQVAFDYDKHGKLSHKIWRKVACSFCVLDNHNVSRCWKKIDMHRKLLKQRKQKAKGPLKKKPC